MSTPIADMVERMLSGGIPPEFIVLAVRTAEIHRTSAGQSAGSADPFYAYDTAADRRRAYDRERKRREKMISAEIPPKIPPDSTGIPPEQKKERKVSPHPSKERKKPLTEALPISETSVWAVADATRPNAEKIFDEEFWPAYPKREGANPREPARKSFLAAVKGGTEPSEIVEGLTRFRAETRRLGQEGTPFVVRAKTFLSERRWEDYRATGPPPDQPAYMTPPPGAPSYDECMTPYRKKPNGEVSGAAVRGDAGMGKNGTDRCAQLQLSGGSSLRDPLGEAPRHPPDDHAAKPAPRRLE